MHKAFISYHHGKDQYHKERLLEINRQYQIFVDQSVDTGDISDDLDDSAIREKIRDEYLRDSTVTIVLVGLETCKRKHVDWEIYSSMFDGRINKRSGVLVVNLPSTYSNLYWAVHEGEKEVVYPEISDWISIDSWEGLKSRYPHMPDRIIDNLLKQDAKVSVASWSKIENDPEKLSFLIDATYKDRTTAVYDLSRPMRRANS